LGSLATPATRDRVVASSPYSRETIEGRALLWTETTHLIEDNLVLGLGAGGYVNSIPSYHNLQWQLEVGPANPPDSPHNWLLQAGADGGLPLGLAALALAVAVLLGGLTSTRQQQTRGERAAVVGMLAGVSGYGAALLFHFTSPGTTPLAAMLAGVLVANSALGRDERRGEAPTSRRSRLLATARARNVFDAVMIAAFSALAVLLLLAAVAEIPLRVAIDDASSGNLGAADHNFHIATSLRPWDPSIAATAGHAFAVLATYAEPGAAKRGAPWAAIEVRDDPGGVTPLEDGAEIDTATHQLALAQTLLQRAANIDPTDPDVLLALGKVELQQGLQRRAEAVLEKAARYAPGDKAVREALEAARR
jgi:hypothetical protein